MTQTRQNDPTKRSPDAEVPSLHKSGLPKLERRVSPSLKVRASAQIAGFAYSDSFSSAPVQDRTSLAAAASSLHNSATACPSNTEVLLPGRLRSAFRLYAASQQGIADEARLTPFVEQYEVKFRATIAPLLSQLAKGVSPEKISGFLGSGVNANAFEFRSSGTVLVARIEKFAPAIPDNRALLKSDGMPSTPTLLAFSADSPVQILSRVAGSPLAHRAISDRPQISDGEIARAINIVLEFAGRGILIDCKPGNLLCTEKGELGFIDYGFLKDCPPAVLVGHLFTALSHVYERAPHADPNGLKERLSKDVLRHEVLLKMAEIVWLEHNELLPAFAERVNYKKYFETKPESRFPNSGMQHTSEMAKLSELRAQIMKCFST